MGAEKIYLSKEGKSFGPFTSAQVEEFKKNGQIGQYAWICTDPKAGWVSLAQAPPPPIAVEEVELDNELDGKVNTKSDLDPLNPSAPAKASPLPTGIPTRPATASAPESRTPAQVADTSSILALCHDFKTVVSGSLTDVNSSGATLSKAKPHESMPIFRKGAKVLLNLLDDTTGRSENIRSVVSGASKKEGNWEYRLRWEGIPEILKRP